LVADTIAQGVGATVSATVRDTVAAVDALAADEGVMARAVADKLSVDKSTASRRLRVAADGGYVHNLEDKRGKPGRWVTGDPLPETIALLPDPTQLATVDNTPDQGGCAVALGSEGYAGQETIFCRECGDPIPEAMPPARNRGYCNKGRCIQASRLANT
jgi:hypothetical protein